MEDPVSENPKENKSKVSIRQLRKFITKIQVEPLVLLFGFALGLEDVFIDKLIIDKVCDVQFDYDEEVCENLDSGQYEHEQNKVQRQTSIYGMDRHFTEYLPVVVTVFLLAALGESRGLKLPLLVTTFGQFLKILLLIFNVLYWSLNPVYIVFTFLPYAFCGGSSGFYMSVYAYIGLTSDKKSRTTRIATISVLQYIGMSIGIITAPVIFNKFDYLGVFLSASLVYILAFIYILLLLKNCKAETKSDSLDTKESKNIIKHLKNTFTTAFKKREHRGRAKVIGHISAIGLYIFIMGAPNFYYLYAWDYESYSTWHAVTPPLTLIGTMIILPYLSYIWNIEDSIIGLLGYISFMWQFMLMATAPLGWVMYVASLTGVCGGLMSVSSRSALSKLVPSLELTSVFAVVSALEALIPVVDNPMFTYIYNATLDIFPGTVFAIASCLSAIGCFLYMWLYHPFPEESKLHTRLSVEETTKIVGVCEINKET